MIHSSTEKNDSISSIPTISFANTFESVFNNAFIISFVLPPSRCAIEDREKLILHDDDSD